jgi:response regulator RpfG family c-di-GMP phosphodiesterase
MTKKKKRSHLLIVEDDATSRLIMKKILETAGYTVTERDNIEGAVIAAIEESPNLILLDLVIPHLTGFDFLQIRKTDKFLIKIPVLVTSNLNDRDSVYRAITLGADDYFTKPVNARILLQKILKLLQDKTFLTFKFKKDERPVLQVHTDQVRGQEHVELQLLEIDEFGIKWIAPNMLSRGISYKFSGEFFRDMLGSTPQLMTVVSNWIDAETGSYGGAAEFDPGNDELSKKVRKWLALKVNA